MLVSNPLLLARTYKAATAGGGGGGSQTTTFDPATAGVDFVFTNTNWTIDKPIGSFQTAYSTTTRSGGKHYIEFHLDAMGTTANMLFGIQDNTSDGSSFTSTGNYAVTRATNGQGFTSGTYTSANDPAYTATTGDVIALAIDEPNGKMWIAYNNTFGGNPAAGTNPSFTFTTGLTLHTLCTLAHTSSDDPKVTIHTASSSQTYSPPAGFSTWD